LNLGRPGVLILTGPTCAGKTAVALELAQQFDAEIIGADSRQIYRGMPIGTAAPTAAERALVRHHLVGFLDPRERYSAARFVADAFAAIAGVHARGKRAIVVGGTGFYIRALAGDVALSAAQDETLRARLAREARLHPPEVLHGWLRSRAHARALEVAPGDRYRVLRALEIALLGGERAAAGTVERVAAVSLRAAGIAFAKLVLEVPQAELEARIARRVDAMLAAGLLEEAERVGVGAVAADAVGYPQALAHLAGWSTQPELRAHLVRATRRYAKRQSTWFRSEPGILRIVAGRAAGAAVELLGWR
jgi:tRNA dimethylallyltransferase